MNRIRKLRKQRNMTQQEVGDALGVLNTTISMYECEKRKIDQTTICKLCTLFGCSADYLLGMTDYPVPLTEEDARHLAAYHTAKIRERKIIDDTLAEFIKGKTKKK